MADSQRSTSKVSACLSRCLANNALDSILWLTVSALFILSITGAIAPRKGGFYCNDVYLNKKYTGDTIGIGLLLSVSILVPILFIYLSELWQHGTIDTSKKVFNRRRFSSASKFSRYIVSDFLLGILFTLTLTDIIKDMVSEKRPHFLETCQPTVICGLNNSYVTDFKCTGGNYPKWLVQLDIYKSFPSGHASVSFFAATFMILYIQKRISLATSRILRPWLQLLFIFWAVVCSTSRIVDNRHFWWDVLAGSIIGILGGYLTIISVEQNFTPRNLDSEDGITNEESQESKASAVMMIRNSNAENYVQ